MLNKEEIDWFVEEKGRADFYEHTLMALKDMGIKIKVGDHNSIGCHICKKSEERRKYVCRF